MRDLLRCRRGSAAFATAIALIPLIGVVALGAEAGTWYVIRQQAQNAADAAAYSGAIRLACTLSGGSCDNTQSVDYRGKEFAAQNGFCAFGDSTAYPGKVCNTLPTGISQTVTIEIGDYSGGTFTTPPASSGNAVRARAIQAQPGYLAAILNLASVSVGATGIAQVQKITNLCALSLGPDPNNGNGALKIGGNATNAGSGCGLMSDGSVQLASTPTFTGSGWSLYGSTGCSPTNNCNGVTNATTNYFMPPAFDPLQALKTASFNSRTGNTTLASTKLNQCPATNPETGQAYGSGSKCYNLQPNDSSGAYSGNFNLGSQDFVTFAASGTYFFYNASINVTGGQVTAATGVTVNIVLLGNSSLTINGGTFKLSAQSSNATYSLLNGVLIDDQATGSVNIGGNGVLNLGGTMYFPNADVSFQGTTQPTNTTCTAIIAKTLNITGSAYLQSAGCDANTIAHPQVIALVQ